MKLGKHGEQVIITIQISSNFYITKHTLANGDVIAGFSEFRCISQLICFRELWEREK